MQVGKGPFIKRISASDMYMLIPFSDFVLKIKPEMVLLFLYLPVFVAVPATRCCAVCARG